MNLGKYLEGVRRHPTNYRQHQSHAPHPHVHGTVRRPGCEPGVDRRGQRLGARLRPEQPGRAGSRGRPAATSAAPCRTARWGQNVLTNNYDPDLLNGWGVRPSDWNFGASVQQQILTRMSVEVAYHRRSFPASRCRTTRWSRRPSTPVQHHRAVGSPAARTAAATSCRASTTSTRQVRPDPQQRDRLEHVRRDVAGVQRRRRDGEPAPGRPDAPGRHQHRPDHVEFCDVRAQPAGAEPRHRRRAADLDVSTRARIATSPSGCADPVPGPRVVRDPEDRRADQRRVPEQARPALSGQLRRADRRSRRQALGRPLAATRRTSR